MVQSLMLLTSMLDHHAPLLANHEEYRSLVGGTFSNLSFAVNLVCKFKKVQDCHILKQLSTFSDTLKEHSLLIYGFQNVLNLSLSLHFHMQTRLAGCNIDKRSISEFCVFW